MHNFTPDEILLYVLNELEPDRVKQFETSMQTNLKMKLRVEELQQSLSLINTIQLHPNPKSIELILARLQDIEEPHVV